MSHNNWYVITGASCSGKTTLLTELEKKGYMVIYETARTVIEEGLEQGLSLEEIRKDEATFQRNVLERKIAIEKNLKAGDLVFLDRAIPDTYAYDELLGITNNELLIEAVKTCDYKKVFLLDRLKYVKDEARIETEEEQNILHRLLREAYRKLGFEVITVPVLPVEERVQFVLKHVY